MVGYFLQVTADRKAGSGGEVNDTLCDLHIKSLYIQYNGAVHKKCLGDLSCVFYRSRLDHTDFHAGCGYLLSGRTHRRDLLRSSCRLFTHFIIRRKIILRLGKQLLSRRFVLFLVIVIVIIKIILVIGLAAVIIGEVLGDAILGKHMDFKGRLIFVVIGGIIYYIVIGIVLWLKMPIDDLKLF